MIGLLILGGLALFVVAANWVSKWIMRRWLPETRLANRKARAIVRIVLVLMCFVPLIGDHVIARIEVNRLCNQSLGWKVYKTVDGVQAVYTKNAAQTLSHYRILEANSTKYPGKFVRYTLNSDRTRQELDGLNAIISDYEIEMPDLNDLPIYERWLNLTFSKEQYRIIQRSTGEVLAEYVTFVTNGGWLNRLQYGLIAGDSDHYRESCTRDPPIPRFGIDIVKTVLKSETISSN